MKILMISHRVPWPLNEGGTIAIYNNLRGYTELGHDVTLLALMAEKHGINTLEANAALKRYCHFEVVPINTGINLLSAFLNLFSNRSYNVERFRSRTFDKLISQYLTNHSYDLIQLEGTYSAPYTETVLKYRSAAKVVLRQHNVEYQIWQRLAENTPGGIKKWYLKLLAKRLYRFEKKHLNMFDAIVPITNDDAERFLEMGCKVPIHVAPAGIDIDLWSNGRMKGDPLKLYHIGSLEWRPNIDAVNWFIDDIWPGIHADNSNTELYIAGKGMPDEMRNRKSTGVYFVGEVDNAQEFIRDKGICIVPLRSGSGIRVKILEAMSAGKPVVCTSIGAQGIDYKDKKNILIADDATSFKDHVLALISAPDLYADISTEARKLIESRYSNIAVVKRLIAHISEL